MVWPTNFHRVARETHSNRGSAWVKTSNQIQSVLGPEQVNAIATRLGVDPAIVSTFLAEYLPKIVDKLTPAGKIDPAADQQQGLAALLPSPCKALVANLRPTAQRAHNLRGL